MHAKAEPDHEALAATMRGLLVALYPLCRSITGDGVRATLDLIGETLPLRRSGLPSGSAACDWTINDEWNVRDAYVANASGHRVIDFREHNLHLMSYSVPVRRTLSFAELRPHLFTLPEHPDWIPYRTTYYKRTWGFCLTQRRFDELAALGDDVEYAVVVDSTLAPGELVYAEHVVPGESDEEVLFTAHVCHPSIANDNLTGIAVACALAREVAAVPTRRYTYRFLFAPGTIGSLAWLQGNRDLLDRIRHGVVLTGLGGPGPLVYKRTRRGDRDIDRVAEHVLGSGGELRDYSPYGYDERQFNAIGFDLAVGRLSRTPHGEYAEYHTSADDLSFVKDGAMVEAVIALRRIVGILENDRVCRNLAPYGEPQLGARGLYPTVGGQAASDAVMAMLWTLGYSDGTQSLLDIARRAGLDFELVHDAAARLEEAGLLAVPVPAPAPAPAPRPPGD